MGPVKPENTSSPGDSAVGPIDRLLDVMTRLRDPQTGCPWDRRQSFETIAPYTIEEAYEVADAIERGDYRDLRDELGDLLLQVIYHARIASELGHFDFKDVVRSITAKMVRRHPHVFDDLDALDDAELAQRWEADKAHVRGERGQHGVFDGIARNLPALREAYKLQSRAARYGFDWRNAAGVFDKLDEELAEARSSVAGGDDPAEEIGDLLFTVVNLSRHFSISAEDALRQASRKFERRFAQVEDRIKASGRTLDDVTLGEMDTLWEEVKAEER